MGNGTGGSRSLAVGGTAIFNAALKVQDKARRIAARMLEAAPEDIVLADGRYGVRGAPASAVTLAAIAAHAYGNALPEGVDAGPEAPPFLRPPPPRYPLAP